MVLHQSYMTQSHSLFTLISYYAIVFSFALCSLTVGLLSVRWLFYCFCLLAESYETINHYHYIMPWLTAHNVRL